MTSWFRSMEDFLESVDRTAANVAVPRDRQHVEKEFKLNIDDQLAALEPTGNRKQTTTLLKEKPVGRSPKYGVIDGSGKPQEDEKSEKLLENISFGNGDLKKATTTPISRRPSQEFRSPEPADNSKEATNDAPDIEEQTLFSALDTSKLGQETAKLVDGDLNTGGNGIINIIASEVAGDESKEGSTPAAIEVTEPALQLSDPKAGVKSPTVASQPQENGSASDGPQETASDAYEGQQQEGSIVNSTEVSKATKTLAVQRELDEARGLLKHAPAGGQSKEARLQKICAALSQRMQEYKTENAQLEELLSAERDGRGSMDSTVKALQQQLAQARADLETSESNLGNALGAKNVEIDTLTSIVNDTKRQNSLLEGKLAALQADTEVLAKTRDVSEARMIQALRDELSAAERRFEDERTAHSSTRQSAAEREIELEQRMTESTAGLARMQRVVDDRTQRALDLEEKISQLEMECATLNQELQEGEARWRREQKRPSEEPYMAAQASAWREEAERARHVQHEAEARIASMEAENQKLRVDLEARKRDMEGSSMQAHAELEKRFRELTELLYLKQTQLESMASEKQAAQLHLEKETRRFREVKAQAERDNKAMRRLVMTADDEDADVSYFEALGLQQRRVSPSIEKAAKLLDKGAVTAGRFLWRRPLARLALLFYFVFVHLFLMYLLHRLQAQAQADDHDEGFAGTLRSSQQSFP